MNSILSIHTIRFVVLIFLQVLMLNHIDFLGYINPYIYIIFIALFPAKNNRSILIALSFLLGITMDMFLDTGGIHAAACVLIAYARPLILKWSFGMSYEYHSIRFNTVDFGSKLTYFTILTLWHHLVLFSLEIFSMSRILLIFEKTLFTSIFTIILSIVMTVIFTRHSK